MLSTPTNTHRAHYYNHSSRNALNPLASPSFCYFSGNSLSLGKYVLLSLAVLRQPHETQETSSFRTQIAALYWLPILPHSLFHFPKIYHTFSCLQTFHVPHLPTLLMFFLCILLRKWTRTFEPSPNLQSYVHLQTLCSVSRCFSGRSALLCLPPPWMSQYHPVLSTITHS